MENLNNNQSEYNDRLKKLKDLEESGINPYPAKVNRTHTVSDVLLDFKKITKKSTKVNVVGRIMLFRPHGKLAFAQLKDQTGDIQLVFSKDELSDVQYKIIKKIDVADFLEVTGTAFVTQKGENSLLVKNYTIISKALRPLPDKWHGLKDEEEKFRKRYLDILMDPGVKDMFIKKGKFWNAVRMFLLEKGFMEVETPIFENTTGGADARPFVTHHNALDLDVYLRISCGELWQKELMVAGYEKTFEIGRIFRNEGIDPEHAQDYTQMEFYWAYADYQDGMDLVEDLYKYVAEEVFGTTKFQIGKHKVDLSKKWQMYDYSKIILQKTKIDIAKTDIKEIETKLQELKIDYSQDGFNITRAIDNLWKYCRKDLTGPGFLINAPIEVSPLAKKLPNNPKFVQRFQPIIAGSELGNGYSELNNPVDQKERFEEQAKLREAGDDEAQMFAHEFVEALEHGMPPTCGYGMSERVFSFLMDKPIRECQIFPLLKPKNNSQLKAKTKPNNTKSDIKSPLNRDKAFELLKKHMKEDVNLFHSLESEAVMRGVAEKLGEDQETWGILGLLHDVDWEYGETVHCEQVKDILSKEGFADNFIETIVSHGYGVHECAGGKIADKTRTKTVEFSLAASETITGLIYASALVRPDKKLESVKVSSIKKKMKDKSFAAKVNRDVIREIEQTGISLDEFIEIALNSMKRIAGQIGF